MNHLRAIPRLLLFLVWSTAGASAAFVSNVVGRLSPFTGARWHAGTCRIWARGLAAIVGLRIHVTGRPPEPPFVLVCNHLGYVDIVTLMSQAPGVFVSRADLASWPFLGLLARLSNSLFVDRASRRDVVRVNELIGGVLRQGRGIVIFPEGTSSSGKEVLPFRSSLLEPAIRIGHPVSYASLSYRTPAGSPDATRAVCWWGDMTFPKHFYELLQLPRIDADLTFGPEHVQADDRHELAHMLWSAVTRQFRPVTEARCV